MHRSPTKFRAGFSLLETMLAVALSAILMGLIAAGMQLYTQIVADRNADVTNAQLARAILNQMTLDVRAAFYEEPSEEDASIAPDDGASAGTGDASSGDTTDTTAPETTADLATTTVSAVPGVYGSQTELRVDVRGNFPHPLRYDTLVGSGRDPLLDNLLSVDQVVTYYLRSSSPSELEGTPLESNATDQSQSIILVRRIQKRAEAELESQTGAAAGQQMGEQLLSDQVVALEFAYHDGYDWTETWDSELNGGLPIAVRATVTIGDPSDDQATVTSDNVFQTTIAIPTAVVSEDTTSLGGI